MSGDTPTVRNITRRSIAEIPPEIVERLLQVSPNAKQVELKERFESLPENLGLLARGTLFLKHSKNRVKKPSEKKVFYEEGPPGLGNLYCTEPSGRKKMKKVRLEDICDIFVGKKTKILSRSSVTAVLDSCCFSVYTSSFSLDLQANSEEVCSYSDLLYRFSKHDYLIATVTPFRPFFFF